MLKIDRKKDNRVIRAFTHKVADIPNGITVSADDLTQKVLHEGTPVGKDENGLYHVVKVAVLTDDATNSATTYTVKKGHNFKVGDVLMLAPGGAAYAITAIATNSGDGQQRRPYSRYNPWSCRKSRRFALPRSRGRGFGGSLQIRTGSPCGRKLRRGRA